MSEDLFTVKLDGILQDYRNEDYTIRETVSSLVGMGFRYLEAFDTLRDMDSAIFDDRLEIELSQ